MKTIVLSLILLSVTLPAVAAASQAVAVLFDISKSVPERDMIAARKAVEATAAKLEPGSNAFFYTFGEELRKVDADALSLIRATDSYTNLYDAAYDVALELAQLSADTKAIILVSDGYDTRSATILEDVTAFANAKGIVIYGIAAGKANRKTLERIAKLTGGTSFNAGDPQLALLLYQAIHVQPKVAPSGVTARMPAPPVAMPVQPSSAAPAQQAVISVPTTQPASSDSVQWRLWPLLVGAGAFLVLIGGFVAARYMRESVRTCPTCAKRLEPYQTICSECSIARSPQPSDATQEIDAPLKTVGAQSIPVELLQKKPVAEELLSKTFVLMETPILVVRNGRNQGQSFALNPAIPLSIGRSRVNEIRLEDSAVSSQHCRLIPENGHHILCDLGSTNGTFLNERKISKAVLKEGDTIRIGETQFLYKVEQHRT